MNRKLKKIIKAILPNRLVMQQLVCKDKNCVLLSFDDGPSEKFTPQVLSILDKFEAKALFFITGVNAQLYPDIVKKIHSKGHIIGNHTFSHMNARECSIKSYIKDISRCQNIINSITGCNPLLFRPPYGVINHKSITAALLLKLKIVLCNVDGGDWTFNISSSPLKVANDITKKVKPNSIILLHDNNIKTPSSLEIILNQFRSSDIELSKGVEILYSYFGFKNEIQK